MARRSWVFENAAKNGVGFTSNGTSLWEGRRSGYHAAGAITLSDAHATTNPEGGPAQRPGFFGRVWASLKWRLYDTGDGFNAKCQSRWESRRGFAIILCLQTALIMHVMVIVYLDDLLFPPPPAPTLTFVPNPSNPTVSMPVMSSPPTPSPWHDRVYLVLLLGIFATSFTAMILVANRQRRAVLESWGQTCPNCLYSVRAVSSAERCPECGLRLDRDMLSRLWAKRYRQLRYQSDRQEGIRGWSDTARAGDRPGRVEQVDPGLHDPGESSSTSAPHAG